MVAFISCHTLLTINIIVVACGVLDPKLRSLRLHPWLKCFSRRRLAKTVAQAWYNSWVSYWWDDLELIVDCWRLLLYDRLWCSMKLHNLFFFFLFNVFFKGPLIINIIINSTGILLRLSAFLRCPSHSVLRLVSLKIGEWGCIHSTMLLGAQILTCVRFVLILSIGVTLLWLFLSLIRFSELSLNKKVQRFLIDLHYWVSLILTLTVESLSSLMKIRNSFLSQR